MLPDRPCSRAIPLKAFLGYSQAPTHLYPQQKCGCFSGTSDSVDTYLTNQLFNPSRLDRLSYLRQSTSFLNSSLHSPLARFILFHDLKPLAFLPSDASSGAPAELATVGWEKVKEIIGEEADGFGFGEDGQVKTNGVSGSLSAEAGTEGTDLKPILIFLGVEETTGDESSSTEPKDLSKTTDRIPTGTRPYFALEVTHLPSDVRDHIVSTFEIAAGKSNDGKPAFHDLRSLPIPLESTPADAAAEARAVIDWNRR